ncbi:MAG: efflux RND transporter periplasmic adaptor subunit [Sulfurovum sp.]|nr:efflux RND transporter periplasmic adaptor subunit [Sulfurovum sp.]
MFKMKSNWLTLLFILSTLTLQAEMKCEAEKCQTGKCEVGKCGSALIKEDKVPKKDLNKQETSNMKCAEGKCGSSMTKDVPTKDIPQKEENSGMKCEAGKCGSSMGNQEKKIPAKNSHKASKKNPTVEQLFNVRTVEVKEIQSSKKQINYGYIVAQDSRIIDVTAWFSGYVKELYVDTIYQKVIQGEALALIYSPEVYKAKQDYLNAIKFHTKRPSDSMVQSAKTKLILLGVSQTEILEVSNKKKVSRYTTIYAPAAGWIFEKNINQGSYINNQKSLYKITDLSQVWLEAKLFQEQLSQFEKFDNFTVTIKGQEKLYKAKKELLYPMIDTKEATTTLRLSIANEDEVLKPGMCAKLHASSQSSTKLVIPRTAAMRKSGIWYVFLATEFKGEYEPLSIELKPLDNKHFEVTKGLVAGDKVVNNALFMMDSDAQINSIY